MRGFSRSNTTWEPFYREFPGDLLRSARGRHMTPQVMEKLATAVTCQYTVLCKNPFGRARSGRGRCRGLLSYFSNISPLFIILSRYRGESLDNNYIRYDTKRKRTDICFSKGFSFQWLFSGPFPNPCTEEAGHSQKKKRRMIKVHRSIPPCLGSPPFLGCHKHLFNSPSPKSFDDEGGR